MGKVKYSEWTSEDKLQQIEAWAADGLTEAQIAHNIGIARQTLRKWKKAYSSIGDTLKKGKEVADLKVENALFRRAVGYTTISIRKMTGKNGDYTETVIKEVPPDTASCIFWLKNRLPDKWRDRQAVSVEADIEDLSPLVELLK